MAQSPTGPILVAIDGEPHTDRAVEHALSLAAESGARVVALHVKDPYLKQFASEIYAQGREEYVAHVDECLEAQAHDAVRRFLEAANRRSVEFEVKVIEGDTAERLCEEIDSARYGAVVLGGEQRRRFGAWRSKGWRTRLARRMTGSRLLWIPTGP